MRSLNSARLPRQRLSMVLGAIPFFARVQSAEPKQMQVLYDHARLVELQPGEVVIRAGEFDSWFFFVLKGHLLVGRGDGEGVLAQLSPGDVFGALAVIRDSERSATIAASEAGRAVLLGIDSAPFGDIDDIENVSLSTKSAFLETVNAELRARLMLYRQAFPEKSLAKTALPASAGTAFDLAELLVLAEEAEQLAEQLLAWNGALDDAEHSRFAALSEARPDLISGWDALIRD